MIRDDNYRKVRHIPGQIRLHMYQTSKPSARKEVEYTAEELVDALYECRDPEK